MQRRFITVTLLRNIAGLLAVLAASLFFTEARAHGIKDIRINEILVINEDNYIDSYGHRVGWIELHNTGHSKLDVGGCYLTVWRNGEEAAYRIPTGDPRTVIGPEGYIVFFAEGTASKGTFHTNFTLDRTGYIALYDQSGRGLIDEVDYDVSAQRPDVSMGIIKDENGKEVFTFLTTTTPMSSNEELPEIPASELFRMRDPTGLILAIMAISLVFSSLVVLYLIFRTIGKASIRATKRKRAQEEAAKAEKVGTFVPVAPEVDAEDIHGEELAALTMAVYQYLNDLHDMESNVITINRVARAYSPWNSKIYGLRQLPMKK